MRRLLVRTVASCRTMCPEYSMKWGRVLSVSAFIAIVLVACGEGSIPEPSDDSTVPESVPAAKVMNFEKLGTLEPGKWADFVVLNANPLDDIKNTRRIHAVWVGGRQLGNRNVR
jgi:alpha-D-ribose 1-methylphosphonate 5-triphosphate diphosphatase PhnM